MDTEDPKAVEEKKRLLQEQENREEEKRKDADENQPVIDANVPASTGIKDKKSSLKINIPPAAPTSHLRAQTPTTGGPMRIAVFIKERKLDEGRRMLLLEEGKATKAGEVKDKMLDNLSIPKVSAHLFALWLVSPYLELQLKAHHVPFLLRKQWSKLLQELSNCPKGEEDFDEPVLVFQRNSFITVEEEEKETDLNALKRLFEEASQNILKARYPVPAQKAECLGGILLNIYEGKFDRKKHTAGYFKKRLSEFLPYYAIGSNKISQYIRSSSAEQRLLDQYEKLSENLDDKLSCYKEFLKHCRDLEFYGCAFFKGSVYVEGGDYKVWKAGEKAITVGISRRGVTLFKGENEEVLVHFYLSEISWDYKKDEENEEQDGEPPLEWFIIEFDYTKDECRQIHIISKQACMMDAMVQSCSKFANEANHKVKEKGDFKKILDISVVPKTVGERTTENNFTLTRTNQV